MVSVGGNLNCCYSRDDPRPVLYHLLIHKHTELAEWAIDQGANPEFLLRWKFVVKDKVMTPKEILALMNKHNIRLSLKSDDGFNYNIMHYMCYFGDVEGVRMLADSLESQSLINDPTEGNDIALTIALLSPMSTVEVKTEIALLLYESSNISLCNKSQQNPVQLAMLLGKTELLFRMLCMTSNVRYDYYGNSYLHLAIKAGLSTLARFIFRYTSTGDLNKKDCHGDTVLTLAIKRGDEKLADSILAGDDVDPSISCKNWNTENSQNDLVIHQSLKRGMPYLANDILEKDQFFLESDTEGNLPIHLALTNHLDISVNYMLNHDRVSSYMDQPDGSNSDTPLHLALKLGNIDHCVTLLNKGANVNAVNRQGLTPIHVLVKAAMNEYSVTAVQHPSPDQYKSLLSAILSRSPKLHLCEEMGADHKETALHMAIRGGAATEDLAMMLLEKDSSLVDARDYENCTPLIRAVEVESLRLVQALVSNGADLGVVNPTRDTPLHIAVRKGNREIVRFLVDHGSFIRLWNADGYFPAHLAILNRDCEALQMLCQNNIDSNLQTTKGQTCFMLACQAGSFECAAYLLDYQADPYLLDHENRCCMNVVAQLVRENPEENYDNLAYLVSGLTDRFAMECFACSTSIQEDCDTLQNYLRESMSNKRFDKDSFPVVLPDMMFYNNNNNNVDIAVEYPQVDAPEAPSYDRRQSFLPHTGVNRDNFSPPQSPSLFASSEMQLDEKDEELNGLESNEQGEEMIANEEERVLMEKRE